MAEPSIGRWGPVDTSRSPHALLHTLPVGSVSLTDGLLADRQSINRSVSLRHGYRMLEQAGNFFNLHLALGEAEGEYRGPVFMDSDIYKWLEAASYELGNGLDAELKQMVDNTIALLSKVQMPDGYLNSYYQAVMPDKRWTNLAHDHEMYCAGHLFQAAVAHHRITEEDSLLDIARRFADHIDSVFGPGKRPGTPGHPEIEMALVELYRVTGETRYLDLSHFLLEQRGRGLLGRGRLGSVYFQDHVPVREASSVVGHAVRQLYLTTGATDIYLETGDQTLLDAMTRLWHDLVAHKLYVTTGVGARYEGEAFGEPYELPNDRAYCESCAAIASIMWNWRMLLATGDAQYAELMERTIYNSLLASVSQDGMHYFYVNPLLNRAGGGESGHTGHQRTKWHGCACCPPNIMRTLSSLAHYFLTSSENGVQVHMYAPMQIDVQHIGEGDGVRMRVETDYPWAGHVKLYVEESGNSTWRLDLRLPAWCDGYSLRVNGQAVEPVNSRGYLGIERVWQRGDCVEFDVPMQATLLEAHPCVDPARGSVVIQHGPLVFCLEECDHPGIGLMHVELDPSKPLNASWVPDVVGGVLAIEASGYELDMGSWSGQLYRPIGDPPLRSPVRLRAIPYFAWANRQPGAMRVWIPRCPTSSS